VEEKGWDSEKVTSKRVYIEGAMSDEKKEKRKRDGRYDYEYKKGAAGEEK